MRGALIIWFLTDWLTLTPLQVITTIMLPSWLIQVWHGTQRNLLDQFPICQSFLKGIMTGSVSLNRTSLISHLISSFHSFNQSQLAMWDLCWWWYKNWDWHLQGFSAGCKSSFHWTTCGVWPCIQCVHSNSYCCLLQSTVLLADTQYARSWNEKCFRISFCVKSSPYIIDRIFISVEFKQALFWCCKYIQWQASNWSVQQTYWESYGLLPVQALRRDIKNEWCLACFCIWPVTWIIPAHKPGNRSDHCMYLWFFM